LEGLVKETEERFPHDTEAIAAWIGALTPLLKHGLQERHGWDMIEDFFKELLNQGGFNDVSLFRAFTLFPSPRVTPFLKTAFDAGSEHLVVL